MRLYSCWFQSSWKFFCCDNLFLLLLQNLLFFSSISLTPYDWYLIIMIIMKNKVKKKYEKWNEKKIQLFYARFSGCNRNAKINPFLFSWLFFSRIYFAPTSQTSLQMIIIIIVVECKCQVCENSDQEK